MRTDNGYLRRSLVEVVYPGARYATLPAVAPWSWALRPCCLSSCAAQGSSRLSGANGGPTRSGPAVVGDSMADFVGSRWMSSSSSSVSGLVNALLRVTLHIVLNPWSQLCCDVTGLPSLSSSPEAPAH